MSALVLLATLVLATCSGGDPFEPLPVPPPNPGIATTTTAPPDLSGVALAPVEGTTTTSEVVIGPGPATLAGRVDGPDGPVAGATVRLERLVGDAVATLDVTTAEDGQWRAPDVLGGRYRIRGWLAPTLAVVEPQILFVEGREASGIVLVVQRFGPSVVDLAVAPDPPRVGRRTNVVVRLSSQVVDDAGVVRATPLPGVAVSLDPGGSWNLEGAAVVPTDGAGGATFTLVCGSSGPQPLVVTIPPGDVVPLAPPDCVVPPPTTTTPPETAPPTTAPPATAPPVGSSTSSTSR
jgi:hypothetical protein